MKPSRMRTLNRVYPPDHKCEGCSHIMKYHDQCGCNVKYCMCKVANRTTRQMTHLLLFSDTLRNSLGSRTR